MKRSRSRWKGLVEPTSFGHGWISGVLSVTFGAMGLGGVICFHFPAVLTMPELRDIYSMAYVRALLHLILLAGSGVFTRSPTQLNRWTGWPDPGCTWLMSQ